MFNLSSVGDDGVSDWKLEGDSANIEQDDVNIKNVRIKSHSKDSSVTMTCKKGLIKKNNSDPIKQTPASKRGFGFLASQNTIGFVTLM